MGFLLLIVRKANFFIFLRRGKLLLRLKRSQIFIYLILLVSSFSTFSSLLSRKVQKVTKWGHFVAKMRWRLKMSKHKSLKAFFKWVNLSFWLLDHKGVPIPSNFTKINSFPCVKLESSAVKFWMFDKDKVRVTELSLIHSSRWYYLEIFPS